MKFKDLKDGMEIVLRNGNKRYIIDDELYVRTLGLDYRGKLSYLYNDDLKAFDSEDDIVQVWYDGNKLWEREIDWDKVEMGTKVIAWDNVDDMYEGKFVYYDSTDENKYLVLVSYERYIEDGITVEETDAIWFENCRLKEGI